MTKPAWLIEAEKHIGIKEVDGKGFNPTIKKMWDQLGLKFVDDSGNEFAWCSIFLCYCCDITGYQSPKRQGTRYWRVDWSGTSFKGATKLDKFKLGAIAAFWVMAPDKTPGHTGFALEESADGKFVYILDGNSGNSVRNRTKMPKSKLWGYYWPDPKGKEAPKKGKDAPKKGKEPSWLDIVLGWFS